MRYIIIGSGIAGITAAQVLREHDSDAKITVFSNEVHPLGLYVRKDLARSFAKGMLNEKAILIENEQTLKLQNIHLVYEPIERIYPRRHEILRKHSIRQRYDRLLLATGSTPKLVNAPGLHLIGVHQVRSYEDVTMIEAWLPDLQEQGAVVIGGGLLGLEMAYALNKRGVPTTLLVRESQLGSHLLPQRAAELLEQKVRADGITVILGQEVSAYVSSDDKVLDGVQLTNGEIIATRMALCAVGVHPNTDLAEGALEIDAASGAIIVNDLLQTSQPDVYAAGGCALVNGIIAHNWSSSEQQGRIAALNMLGNTTAYGNYAPFDLQTYIYDLPFAYFGKQVAVSDEQAWVWHDNGTQFAQILVEDGRVMGATLMGEIASFAPTLWQIYKTQAAVELNQLVHFVTP